MSLHQRVRSVLAHATLVLASLILVFIAGEITCRVLFLDTALRYLPDDAALYRLAPNQRAILELANGMPAPPARINRLGARGLDPTARQPVILILGDSFTFGWGVGDEETFAARLQQWLGRTPVVVNGGHPGYGVFQMEATLRRLSPELRPALVVAVIWQGDLLRQPPTAADRERFAGRQQLSAMVKRSLLVTHLYRRFERLMLRTGHDRLVLRIGEGGVPAAAGSVRAAHLEGLKADLPRLIAMRDHARRYGGGLLVVLWPKEDYVRVPEAERGLAGELTLILDNFTRQHGISFVSIQPAMEHVRDKSLLLIPDDWHPTTFAHCIVAAHLAGVLKDFGVRVNTGPC